MKKYTSIDSNLPYVVGRMTDGQPKAIAAFSDQQQATSWHGNVASLPQFKDCELYDNVQGRTLIEAKSGQKASTSERELESQR